MEFLKFDLGHYSSEIESAKQTALLKCGNTFDSWQKRTDFERFINIFYGDLAKNLIKNLIQHNLKNMNVNINNIIEYDEVRNDNFKYPDKYDLILCAKKDENKQTKIEIEVKSSLEKYITKEVDIKNLNNRRIIFNLENEHENITDVIMQIFFFCEDNKLENLNNEFKNKSLNEVDEYFNKLKELKVFAYFMGYINKKMQIDLKKSQKEFIVSQGETKNFERKYGDFLVKNAKKPEEFINNLNKFFQYEIELNEKETKVNKAKIK